MFDVLTISDIMAIKSMRRTVAMFTITTLVAKFTVFNEEAVKAVTGMENTITVVTIFTFH